MINLKFLFHKFSVEYDVTFKIKKDLKLIAKFFYSLLIFIYLFQYENSNIENFKTTYKQNIQMK